MRLKIIQHNERRFIFVRPVQVYLTCLRAIGILSISISLEESSGAPSKTMINITRLFYSSSGSKSPLSSISWNSGSCTKDSRDFAIIPNMHSYWWDCNEKYYVLRKKCFDHQCTNCSQASEVISMVEASSIEYSVGAIFIFQCGDSDLQIPHSSALIYTVHQSKSSCVETGAVLVQQALGVCVPALSDYSRTDCCGESLVARRGCSDFMCRNCSLITQATPFRASNYLCSLGRTYELISPCTQDSSQKTLFRVSQKACLWFVGYASQPQLQIAPSGIDRIIDEGVIFNADLLDFPSGIVSRVQLNGTTSMIGRCGAATFTDLRIDTVGAYMLRVTASFANSSRIMIQLAPLTVMHGEPSRLYLAKQPAGFKAGRPFKVQPLVSILDVGSNLVTNGARGVWVKCFPLSCVLSKNYRPLEAVFQQSEGGMADFTLLGVQAKIYPAVLRFYSDGLAAIESNPFSVMDTPYRISIVAQPPPIVQAGIPWCMVAQMQSKNEAPFTFFETQPTIINASLVRQLYQSSFPVAGWTAGAAVDVRTGLVELCGLVIEQLLTRCYLQLSARILLDGSVLTLPQVSCQAVDLK
jgi:hypothetical protein